MLPATEGNLRKLTFAHMIGPCHLILQEMQQRYYIELMCFHADVYCNTFQNEDTHKLAKGM